MIAALALALMPQIPSTGKAGDAKVFSRVIDRFALAGHFQLPQNTSANPSTMSSRKLSIRHECAGDNAKGCGTGGDIKKAIERGASLLKSSKGDSAQLKSPVVHPSFLSETMPMDVQNSRQEIATRGEAYGEQSSSMIESFTVEALKRLAASDAAQASIHPMRNDNNTGLSSQHAPKKSDVMPPGDEELGGVASQRRVKPRHRPVDGDRFRVRADKFARARQPVKRSKIGV